MPPAKVKQAAAAAAIAPQPAAQIEHAVAAGKQTVDAMVKTSQDAAAKANVQVMKGYEDALQTARESAEAVSQASAVLARGLTELSQAVFGLAQETVEQSMEASRQLMAARTLRDLVDIQSSLAKAQLDKAIAEGSRLSDLSTKLVEEALAPINARVHAAFDRLVKTAA
ncbi:MAG: phasin family protein [Solirubrobacterales bacterium]